jgi:hypothetical protein
LPSFITDTPEKLKVEWVSAKTDLVVIVGDRTKILYEGDDKAFAQQVYDNVKAHYAKRVAERNKPNPKEPNNPALTAENEVQFIPVKKARF